MTHEGASSVHNSESLGDDSNWFDHSRDLLHLINIFRESFPRPVIGLAHSRGCSQIAQLAHIHPRLLSSCIFIEPLMLSGPLPGKNPAYFATRRKDLWASRQEAEQDLRKTLPYKAWNPQVFRRYLDVGLRATPTDIYPLSHDNVKPGSVTLTTTKHQEAWSFARPTLTPRLTDPTAEELKREKLLAPDIDLDKMRPFYSYRSEAFMALDDLPTLRPPVFYISAQKSPFSFTKAIEWKMTTTGAGIGGSGGIALGKVEKVMLREARHYAPSEHIGGCAKACVGWLERSLTEWRKEEEILKEAGMGKSYNGERKAMSQAWVEMTGKDFGAKRPIVSKERL